MAKNRVREHGAQIPALIASVAAGDPQVIGQVPGVALTATDGNGSVTLQTDGIFDLSVKGVDGGGNVAVNNGDILYFVSGDTPKLGKKTSGVRFGYAYSATVAPGAQLIASGATGTISVKIGY